MRKRLYLFILICWLAGIFALMLTPLPPPPEAVRRITYYDKAAHFVFFGVTTYLLIAIGLRLRRFRYWQVALVAVSASSSLALLAEKLQRLVPGREDSWLDFSAGLLGMLFACPIAYLLHHSPKRRLALHVCCAPCTTAVREVLAEGYDLDLIFSNSNIYPKSEYQKRLSEVKRFAKRFGLRVKEDVYRHREWKKAMAGHEKEAEGGERCELCFIYRLKRTAALAKKDKIDIFATTLSISPHKKTAIVNRSGLEAGECFGLEFLGQNFKANDGFKRSIELSKEFDLYRQNYCGCEFSIRPKGKI
jgi:predicted adenine nucleotide alpha hydrolase (AANH) superfamily ATPase/VanZ family protein